MLARACTFVGALFAVLSLTGAGCANFTETNLPEGDRCNPSDQHNECSGAAVCTGRGSAPAIPFCPENYCCSVDGNGNIASGNANCQPGCNGGAASICKANSDPGACAFAGGASLEAATAMDEDAAAPAPATDAGAEGGD